MKKIFILIVLSSIQVKLSNVSYSVNDKINFTILFVIQSLLQHLIIENTILFILFFHKNLTSLVFILLLIC